MRNQRLIGILQRSALSCLLALLTACAGVHEPPQVTQPASSFTATDLTGRSFSLTDYRGKNLVLVFYIGHR